MPEPTIETTGSVSGPPRAAGAKGATPGAPEPRGASAERAQATLKPRNSGAGGPAPPVAPPAPSEPVLLGNVGNYSGPPGNATAAAQPTLQVWARWVNDHGGLRGRPVKVLSADDAGDPSRSQAIVKDMVENRKVIAFLGNTVPITMQASRAYLESKRIPVVGGDMTLRDWNESPVLFPQGTSIKNLSVGLGKYGVDEGHKKFGQLVCVESPACANSAKDHARGVEEYGGELVYSAQISLAQPDYTSECLQAQNRGVQSFTIWADSNSVRRIAASCARQSFRPVFNAMSLTLTTDLEKDPKLEGMFAVVPTFPWVEADTPETMQFHAAMEHYAPNLQLAAVTSNIWTAGKLFEKAVSRISGEITTAAIFEGLWTIQDDNLGGLAPPLRFEKGHGASEAACFFKVKVVQGKWTAQRSNKQDCVGSTSTGGQRLGG